MDCIADTYIVELGYIKTTFSPRASIIKTIWFWFLP